VERSAGSEPASDAIYEEGAFVPRLPWSALENRDLSFLESAQGFCHVGQSIKLIQLPIEYLLRFRQIAGALNACSVTELRIAAASIDSHLLLEDFKECARRTINLTGEVASNRSDGGICVSGRAGSTVTVDPRSGSHVGLHVDDWYRFEFGTRRNAPIRICANFWLV
jgi:hypothetical protein